MGTYLQLELKDKSEKGIAFANALWDYENQGGFTGTIHFRTRQDQLKDIAYIKLDDSQKHLRDLSIKELEEIFGSWFKRGTFKTKITLGDYLCSAMASRILDFIDKHMNLIVKQPNQYVMGILEETMEKNHKASECFADCPYCSSINTHGSMDLEA